MNNVAIAYRGFYKKTGTKPCNFFLVYENHKKYLYDCFKNVDIYFHTYTCNDEDDEKLVKLLNPKKYVIDKKPNTKIMYSIVKTTGIIDSDYDIIINIRFDLLFKKPMNEFNIDYNKFNFIFKENDWDNSKKVSDLLFIFPQKYTTYFIDSLLKSMKKWSSGHWIYPYLEGRTDIHFILDEILSSNTDNVDNELVKILRTE